MIPIHNLHFSFYSWWKGEKIQLIEFHGQTETEITRIQSEPILTIDKGQELQQSDSTEASRNSTDPAIRW